MERTLRARPMSFSTTRSSRSYGSSRNAITCWRTQAELPRYEELVGASRMIVVRESGGKVLVTNAGGKF